MLSSPKKARNGNSRDILTNVDDSIGDSDDDSTISGDSNYLFESYEGSNIGNEKTKSKLTSKRAAVVKPKTVKSIKEIKRNELADKIIFV